MTKIIPTFLASAAICSGAMAQTGTPPTAGKAGEVVITSNGTPSAAWVERKVCDEEKCYVLVLNRSTREIARLDGRLTSAFKATGSGKEVIRAHDKRAP